jgi:hypothetical protein
MITQLLSADNVAQLVILYSSTICQSGKDGHSLEERVSASYSIT